MHTLTRPVQDCSTRKRERNPMLFQQEENSGQLIINSYQPGKIIINQKEFVESVLVSTQGKVQNGFLPASFDELTSAHIDALIENRPEVVLVGTGPNQKAVNIELRKAIIEKGVAVDFMDTRAACRTFTIVSGEGRRAVAALFV